MEADSRANSRGIISIQASHGVDSEGARGLTAPAGACPMWAVLPK